MRRLNPGSITVIALMLLMISASPVLSQGKEITSLHVGYSAVNPPSSLVWIMKEEGLFEENKLQASLIFMRGGTTHTQAIIAGDVQFGQLTGPPGLSAYLAGGPVVYIASSQDMMTYQLVARSDIKNVSQLSGKTLAISQYGASADFALRLMLKHVEINPEKQVKILQIGDEAARLAALIKGHIDGTIVNAPFGLSAKQYNLNVLLDSTKLNIPYFNTGILTTRTIIRDQSDTVRRFMRGYVKAISYFKTRPEPIKKILQRFSKIDDPTRLHETYSYFRENILKIPAPSATGLQTVINVTAQSNPKAKNVKPEDLIEPRFVRELEASGYIDSLYR
ncbi:MAG: ABC transporter substrate-binding protein [Candidatus Binatota bacterium]|jgi:NitT/TauT family transport system substrate-binding protein